jgi:hypothetical protein
MFLHHFFFGCVLFVIFCYSSIPFFFCLIKTFASILIFLYASWLALVLCWSHLVLASFFFCIYCLHSSSHHSFLVVLLCVYMISCAASVIAFIFSHSVSVLFVSGMLFSLLCNDVLNCLSLLWFCIFVLFHFIDRIGFLLYMFGYFCIRVVFNRKWSESMFGPRRDLTSSVASFLFWFTSTWSVWFIILWSGDLQVPLCTRVAQKVMPHIFFFHSRIKIAMWKLRVSNIDVYCAHVFKYTIVRQIAPL